MELKLNFGQEAQRVEEQIIADRKFFHAHPELSYEEENTTKEIGLRLEEMGLKPVFFEDFYGLYADLSGAEEGETVVLRADIDALPTQENTGADYCSVSPGRMHACGHDAHIAMLLGAARVLVKHRDRLKGRVRFLFQAAEESCHGAEYYVKKGVLDPASAIMGMHIWGELDQPKINIASGERMTSCDNFTIKVRGKASHGACPHDGNDAIVAAAAIILQLQTIVSRWNDPRHSLAITIGEIRGGQRFNILADEVILKGTVRTHSRKARGNAEEWIRSVAQNTAIANRTEAQLSYEYYPGPVINDPKLVEIALGAAKDAGYEDLLTDMPKTMMSEDFSYFTHQIPGVYAFIGARNKENGMDYGNHSDHFLPEESVLKRGAALYAQFAYAYLSSEKEGI